MDIINYPKYLMIDNKVVSKDRKFPLVVDASGKYARVFMEDCNGHSRFVSLRELKSSLAPRLEKIKSRGRIVTHVSGKVYKSITEAREATGLTDARLKSHPEYTIA